MNLVYIILWVSSTPMVVNDQQIGVELMDHSSIRDTAQDAQAWISELRSHGVGMSFKIYKSELWKPKEREGK